MPIIKSAKKRVRVSEKAAIRNSKTKRTLKTALKAFRASVSGDNHAAAQSAIDTAAKKGLIHKNKAARQKAQLAKASKAAGAAPASAAAKKPAAKKPTAAVKAQPAATAKPKAAAKTTKTTKTPSKKSAAKK